MTGAHRFPFTGGIYLVTDSGLCGARGVLETVRQSVAGGATAVQIREKTASTRSTFELLSAVAETVNGQAAVLINDRVDIYLAAKATGAQVHGVHIGQSDLDALVTRQLIGDDALLGLTANSPEHFAAVAALPADTVDHLGVGVIRATTTKPDHPTPLGIAGFRELAASTPLPCVAIGGIEAHDVAQLRDAGATAIAVVSAICAADDAKASTAALVAEWNRQS